MNSMKFTHTSSLRGELTVPGDKSISHRSVMFGALADGLTEIHGFLQGADCLSTISCFSKMGISIENQCETVLVHGRGLHGLTAPDSVLDCGNSGTTTRLISGILSAQKFDTTLTGDASIQKRPMKRIIDPLSQMGAKIESVNGNGCAPLHITGSPLHGIHYNSPVASAQVKSSILLAGLYADGETRVTEPYISRDHSERMLSAFGADIHTEGTTAILQPAKQLYGQKIQVIIFKSPIDSIWEQSRFPFFRYPIRNPPYVYRKKNKIPAYRAIISQFPLLQNGNSINLLK